MTTPRPDNFSREELEERLAGSPFGRPLHFFETTDSTNSFLRALRHEECPHGALAVADHQQAGRGKYDRRWVDAPGRSLMFSLALETSRPARYWPLITLGAGVSVCRTLERAGVDDASIRWPNDVLVGGGKVCGILTESGPGTSMLVVGVGLNVHQSAEDFPAELAGTATSLNLSAPRHWNRTELLCGILADFAGVFAMWRDGRDAAILEECRRRLWASGRPVRLSAPGRTVEGVVADIDSDGRLVIRNSTGTLSHWSSAEIEET